jgi:YaiO family outer membrane protein
MYPARFLAMAMVVSGVLLATVAGPARGQSPVPGPAGAAGPAPRPAPLTVAGPPWRTWVALDYHTFLTDLNDLIDWSDWTGYTGGVQRRFDRASLELEGVHSRRFGLGDTGVAVGGTFELGTRSHGNVRGQWFPDPQARPALDAHAQLFRSVGAAWEASVSYRRIQSELQEVDLFGASLARFFDQAYVRGRADVTPSGEAVATFFSLLMRHRLEGFDGLLEGSLGAGSEVVDIGPGPVLDVRSGRVATVGTELFPRPRVGVGLGVGYAVREGLPSRVELAVGGIYRW